MGYVFAVVDIAPRDGLSLAPFTVRLLVADPDSSRAHAWRFAEAHKVQGVAVGCDPRLLVGAIAVDGFGQALSRRPIPSGPRPLAALSDSVGDEDIGRPLNPRVAVVRKRAKWIVFPSAEIVGS